MLKRAHTSPDHENPWHRFVSDQEYKMHNLVQAAGLAADVLEGLISQNPKPVTGNSEFYHITEDQANMALYALYDVGKKTKELRDERDAFMTKAHDLADPLEGRPADVIVKDHQNKIRRSWRTAMAEFACSLPFAQMEMVYDTLAIMGEAALHATNVPVIEGTDGAELVDAMHDDIMETRRQIADYCERAAATKCPTTDALQQTYRDSILLKEYTQDIETNADAIAAIAARYVKPAEQAEAA